MPLTATAHQELCLIGYIPHHQCPKQWEPGVNSPEAGQDGLSNASHGWSRAVGLRLGVLQECMASLLPCVLFPAAAWCQTSHGGHTPFYTWCLPSVGNSHNYESTRAKKCTRAEPRATFGTDLLWLLGKSHHQSNCHSMLEVVRAIKEKYKKNKTKQKKPTNQPERNDSFYMVRFSQFPELQWCWGFRCYSQQYNKLQSQFFLWLISSKSDLSSYTFTANLRSCSFIFKSAF